jgi:hypothetical protein
MLAGPPKTANFEGFSIAEAQFNGDAINSINSAGGISGGKASI